MSRSCGAYSSNCSIRSKLEFSPSTAQASRSWRAIPLSREMRSLRTTATDGGVSCRWPVSTQCFASSWRKYGFPSATRINHAKSSFSTLGSIDPITPVTSVWASSSLSGPTSMTVNRSGAAYSWISVFRIREMKSNNSFLSDTHSTTDPKRLAEGPSSHCTSSTTTTRHRSSETASSRSNTADRTFVYTVPASSVSLPTASTDISNSVSRLSHDRLCWEHPSAPGSSRSLGTRDTNAESGWHASDLLHMIRSTRTPRSSATFANSDESRVLPIPGSPWSRQPPPRPSRALLNH